MADYLLFKLNKSGNFKYVELYGLTEPSDDILDVLIAVAKKHKQYKVHRGMDNVQKQIYDIDTAGHMMIKHFFDGALGPIMLDDELLNEMDPDQSDASLKLDQFV